METKHVALGGQVWSCHTPGVRRPAGGEGPTVSADHEPHRSWAQPAEALSPRAPYRSSQQGQQLLGRGRRGGGEGISPQEAIYKCTAVPLSPTGPSPSTNRVQAGWLHPWAEGQVFRGAGEEARPTHPARISL